MLTAVTRSDVSSSWVDWFFQLESSDNGLSFSTGSSQQDSIWVGPSTPPLGAHPSFGSFFALGHKMNADYFRGHVSLGAQAEGSSLHHKNFCYVCG